MYCITNKPGELLRRGLLVAVVVLLAACSPATPAPTAAPAPTAVALAPVADTPEVMQPIARWNSVTEAGTWVLIGYGDALNPIVVEPGTLVTIEFGAADDTVSGSGGCNTYNTTYSADDTGKLTINGPIASTMMSCDAGMDQEGLFLGALEKVTGYTLTEDGHLLLDYSTGVVYAEQLNFVRGTPLVDTLWVLAGYGDPNNLTAPDPGVLSTAVFSQEGEINGSGGCNQFSAGYQLTNNQIKVTLPASTMMACEKGMEQEQAFLAALQNAASIRVGRGALDIMMADGTSMLRFSAQHLPLENVRWRLASIDGVAVPEDVTAYALFTPVTSPAAQDERNLLSGTAGCNTYFGEYTISGDTFAAGPFASTQMMCDEALMNVEQAFLAGLERPTGYSITLNQLTIKTANGSLLLYADRMPLEGPQWTLTGIGPIGSPQPPLAGSQFTANFARTFGAPSGVKSGSTGCNDYTATYFAERSEIKVNLPNTTRMTCSDAQTDAEQGYFLRLNAARQYRILGNELTIFSDEYALVYTGAYPEAAAGPLAPLNGTTWWLASIGTNPSVPGTEVHISFSIDPGGTSGTVDGSAGCNSYAAQITGVFALSPINATSSLCQDPAGVMEQEGSYLQSLGTANGLSLQGDSLTITTASETLIFTNQGPAPEQPLPTPGPTSTPEVSPPLPVSAVIVAPTEAQAGQPIAFDASLSSSNVGITSYSWDFGDGATGEGAMLEHSYAAAGSFDVVLTVTDANGQTANASIVLTIQ